MSRILFIANNRIGDAVLSAGVLEEARRRLPEAKVVVACGPLTAPLFRAVPNLESLHIIEKVDGRWRKLWGQLRKRKYALAVDLRGSLVTNFLSVKQRYVHKKSKQKQHKIIELSALIEAPGPLAPMVHLDQAAIDAAQALIGRAGPVLALGPGANFIGKRWHADGFSEVARRLAGVGGQGPLRGLPVVLLGAPSEAAITAQIHESLVGGFTNCIDAVGKIDLLAAAALLQRARLFIGNDSGLMHLAAAMNAPTLGLFGPSDERVYGPWGPRSRTLRGKAYDDIMEDFDHRIDYSIMGDIQPDAVEQAALQLLAETA